jgi:hypothetical protein
MLSDVPKKLLSPFSIYLIAKYRRHLDALISASFDWRGQYIENAYQGNGWESLQNAKGSAKLMTMLVCECFRI